MRLKSIHIAILLLSFLGQSMAQISPGDLSTPHAELEGIFNCTKCHVLGEKVSNDKCLECHKELKERVTDRKGYHASKEVKNKECATCHSDHHGRKFKMIRFDEDEFDHDLADYKLEGEHKVIDCRECHVADNIQSSELKKRKNTFLGLGTECLSCHDDYHQKELSDDCAKCHTIDAFSPADKFDHDDADYQLRGKHKEVDCEECHKKEMVNGFDFQHFVDIEFNNCNKCHDDPHQNHLGTNCKQCHVEDGFDAMRKIKRFRHGKTGFPLRGKHKKVNCNECHKMDVKPVALFQDNLNIQANNCKACHEDPHEGKFGDDCASCHTERSFRKLRQKGMDSFNHNVTDFNLVGKHQVVDCRKCHEENFTKPIEHNACASCHVDYHESEFVKNGIGRDCAECHTEDGFTESLFTLENHEKTEFPLKGAHIATPCFDCHLKKEKWHFKNIGSQCVDCHDDIHKDFLDEKYYPNASCEKCHVSDDWQQNHFDHNLTEFELTGAHLEQECMACHRTDEDKMNREKYWNFTGLSSTCDNCHENTHGEQFEVEGKTDCARCHGTESWDAANFNHDATAFKLEGKHAEIACEECHKETEKDGKKVIQYKFKSFECVVCHH